MNLMRLKQMVKSISTVNFPRIVAVAAMAIWLSATALASCGDSLSSMAAHAATLHGQSRPVQPGSSSSQDDDGKASIVGLWHVRFVVGDQTIQEAFQLWNVGGTEIHNPNVDPRTGNVCLGVWKVLPGRGNKLVHRVWWYDASGNFLGTIHLTESVKVARSGDAHSGSFTLDFYDTQDNFQFQVAGDVVAERIAVD